MSRKKEIRKAIEQFFNAMDTRDLASMEMLMPREPEMVHVGTDRGEIWRGYEELHADTLVQFENLEYYKAEVRDLTVHFASSGEVAWYFHLLDAEIRSGGTTHHWEGARFTGVMEKRGGTWKMMQTHVSLPG